MYNFPNIFLFYNYNEDSLRKKLHHLVRVKEEAHHTIGTRNDDNQEEKNISATEHFNDKRKRRRSIICKNKKYFEGEGIYMPRQV